jgi:DNA-binding LytR/AlgR family response regulator
MPGLSGIDFAKTMNQAPAIIFTTAYRDFAIDAFDLQAIDYLLKPISLERFIKAVNRFFALHTAKAQEEIGSVEQKAFIILKADKKQHKVFIDEITYVESLDNYIQVHTKDEKLTCYMSLSAMEDELPADSFIRVHRSYLVNADAFKTFTSAYVEVNGKNIPIGRNYREEVKRRIGF